MSQDFIQGLSPEEKDEYLAFMLHQYRVVDAFWFIRAEEEYGLAAAEALNERVWGKVTELAARDIKKRFGISEKGLEGFARALRYLPWAVLVGYELQKQDGEIVIEVSKCPPQDGRKKHGLGEYSCKAMHLKEFEEFAKEIDPDIEVICEFAPPDPHPEDTYCRWRFRMRDGSKESCVEGK